jgi:hypothetical protein
MVQVICVVGRTPAGADQKVSPEALQGEVNHVRGLYGEGVVRQIWSRADAGGAVLLLEVADLGAAQALVSGLPLARAGVIHLEVAYPLIPYRGFGASA